MGTYTIRPDTRMLRELSHAEILVAWALLQRQREESRGRVELWHVLAIQLQEGILDSETIAMPLEVRIPTEKDAITNLITGTHLGWSLQRLVDYAQLFATMNKGGMMPDQYLRLSDLRVGDVVQFSSHSLRTVTALPTPTDLEGWWNLPTATTTEAEEQKCTTWCVPDHRRFRVIQRATPTDMTTEVQIVSEGEYPPDVIEALQPDMVIVLFENGEFRITQCFFKTWTDQHYLRLLTAESEHKILRSTSIEL